MGGAAAAALDTGQDFLSPEAVNRQRALDRCFRVALARRPSARACLDPTGVVASPLSPVPTPCFLAIRLANSQSLRTRSQQLAGEQAVHASPQRPIDVASNSVATPLAATTRSTLWITLLFDPRLALDLDCVAFEGCPRSRRQAQQAAFAQSRERKGQLCPKTFRKHCSS